MMKKLVRKLKKGLCVLTGVSMISFGPMAPSSNAVNWSGLLKAFIPIYGSPTTTGKIVQSASLAAILAGIIGSTKSFMKINKGGDLDRRFLNIIGWFGLIAAGAIADTIQTAKNVIDAVTESPNTNQAVS